MRREEIYRTLVTFERAEQQVRVCVCVCACVCVCKED